ncbi:hypothetical protein BCR36DRAFT_308885 [Piromyces finnis]|uniref:HTH La-type RNA-binding domain-containing protein n=1 Tax=Piromyces finnis TaxID=1754191 RepID=A0A1Y1UVG5_9FUNG|nr:hypothetical protein BCR36DRAFT_308885 [Piromyces finnis]|eukprot:ORX42029.1 hypothetical protein BCR36DRAFT_308885 [Piromyces finnis]
MNYKELEKEIASKIDFCLSDSNLSYDSLLYSYISEEGWVPISVFILYKLKGLTMDEAEISKSIRKHCKDLEVSEDGKSIRRKKPIPNEFKDDSRTIYIEHLPNSISIEKIKTTFEEFGKIKAIYFPDVKKRMSQNENNKEINSKTDHKKELPIKFLFITYKKKKSVDQAIEKLNTYTQVTKSNFKELINNELNGFRILKIKTWRSMTKEYIQIRQKQIEKLKQNSQDNIMNNKEIEFKPGLIAEFRDYSPHQTYGYIRYKDASSAKIAENYFSRKKVIQVNGLDVSGTLFTTLKKKFEEEGKYQLIHDYEIIRLRILTDDEETEYWSYINGSIKNKNRAINNNHINHIENKHTVFNDSLKEEMEIDNESNGENVIEENHQNDTSTSHIQFNSKPFNEPLNEIKHIRFDDSDNDEENDENEENPNEENNNEEKLNKENNNGKNIKEGTTNEKNNNKKNENGNKINYSNNKDNIFVSNIEIDNDNDDDDDTNNNNDDNKDDNDDDNDDDDDNNNNNNNSRKETASVKKKRKRKYLKKHLKQKEKKIKLKAENEALKTNITTNE